MMIMVWLDVLYVVWMMFRLSVVFVGLFGEYRKIMLGLCSCICAVMLFVVRLKMLLVVLW